jgi:small GTP-binding protein
MTNLQALSGAGTATRLPATLIEVRRLFEAFDWTEMARQVEQESLSQVAIVGPVNSGKSTLFNTLKGRDISPVSVIPGTTRDLCLETWGPLTLVDTPGFGEVDGVDRANIALQAVQSARVVVLVLDAVSGVRQADYALLQRLKATGKPVLVVLNKIDLLQDERQAVIANVQDRLGEIDLIPISAKHGTNVARLLLPRMIDAYPSLAVALGRALPPYRRKAALKVIRSTSLVNAAIGAEPIPGLDIPFLLVMQARMVLRIAAIYGEPMSIQHAKELIATIVGGVALRYLAQEGTKVIPGPGWLVAAAVASAGTWAIGQVAVQYFEHGKELSPQQLNRLYRRRLKDRRGVMDRESTVKQDEVAHVR